MPFKNRSIFWFDHSRKIAVRTHIKVIKWYKPLFLWQASGRKLLAENQKSTIDRLSNGGESKRSKTTLNPRLNESCEKLNCTQGGDADAVVCVLQRLHFVSNAVEVSTMYIHTSTALPPLRCVAICELLRFIGRATAFAIYAFAVVAGRLYFDSASHYLWARRALFCWLFPLPIF